MKTAYFDMFSGVSGDMILGAMVDCGLPKSVIEETVAALGLESVEIKVEKGQSNSITATRLQVVFDQEKQHHHRSLSNIRKMIETSSLGKQVKDLSVRIFTRLGEAEAAVHGTDLEKVHFHEVGAVDSIVDIVGAAAGAVHLGVECWYAGPFRLGTGFVDISHGRIPVPVPATSLLVRGFPVERTAVKMEMTTPTGAAIVSTLVPPDNFNPTLSHTYTSVGYGQGTHQFEDRPNLLRLMLGETSPGELCPATVVMECNIDDMNPQYYDYLMEKLFEAGAHDVFFIPAQMKKNRPAVVLQVLADRGNLELLSRIVLTETTTIGLRYHPVERITLDRRTETVETPWGRIRIKVVTLPDGSQRRRAEYDDLKTAAVQGKIPMPEMASRLEEYLENH